MSWKRSLLEGSVWCARRVSPGASAPPKSPRSILVLRNNDLGDLLVVTPLFEALRRRFPQAEIVAAVGAWNVETLRGNPHLSDVAVVSAPWHNRVTGTRDPRAAVRYLLKSNDVQGLQERAFEIGIDVLGSPFGSLLLMRAGIPWRLGVRGYAGGHSGVQQCVAYDPSEHVGRAALRFAELLGASVLPDTRPQVFLSKAEVAAGERIWREHAAIGGRRIVIAPGGGHPGRAWPVECFVELARQLTAGGPSHRMVIGAANDAPAAARIAAHGAKDLTGRLTWRQSMAVISRADLVYANSSAAMHAAAAFCIPAVVLLGHDYESARAHAAQWGHGDMSLILGRDPGRAHIFDPAEAIAAATDWLARQSHV